MQKHNIEIQESFDFVIWVSDLFSLLRLIFLQKWKEKLKIWNSRNQEIFVFTFVSS